jgi:hypothetical protein
MPASGGSRLPRQATFPKLRNPILAQKKRAESTFRAGSPAVAGCQVLLNITVSYRPDPCYLTVHGHHIS